MAILLLFYIISEVYEKSRVYLAASLGISLLNLRLHQMRSVVAASAAEN
jgi:hypothetical protein